MSVDQKARADSAEIAAVIVPIVGQFLAVVLIITGLAVACAIIGDRRPPACTQGSIVSYLTNCEVMQ